jgi:hypothetical protein
MKRNEFLSSFSEIITKNIFCSFFFSFFIINEFNKFDQLKNESLLIDLIFFVDDRVEGSNKQKIYIYTLRKKHIHQSAICKKERERERENRVKTK